VWSVQSKIVRFIEIFAAIGLIAANSAHAQSQPTATQGDQPNRVLIEYVRPQNADFQDLYEALKTHGALEKIQKILSPMRLPEPLTVKTMECGKVDAWYRREDFVPTVTICYELLKHVLDSLPKDSTPEGITADDAKVGQVLWFTLHEAGHAAFDVFDVPVFGHEEDAADNFATYIMLQFAEAPRLIRGAAWAWNEYMQDYKRNPVVRVRLAGFAGNHGLPQERFYNLACLAFGSNPERFADLERYLPDTRAQNCVHEYFVLANAFHKQMYPHIDFSLAKGVTEANWLPGPALRSEP
jgi:Putative metallopeptidase